jgi:hypothetical protein
VPDHADTYRCLTIAVVKILPLAWDELQSALSTVAGACSATRTSDAGGQRDATGLPGKEPPFRGDLRGRRLLLPDTGSHASDAREDARA